MSIELNRRTFITLLGATAAATAMVRPARAIDRPRVTAPVGPATPLYFFTVHSATPPATPRTSAVSYMPV